MLRSAAPRPVPQRVRSLMVLRLSAMKFTAAGLRRRDAVSVDLRRAAQPIRSAEVAHALPLRAVL